MKPKVLGPIGCSDHCVIEWKSKEQLHDKNKTRKIKARPIKESSLWLFDDYISLQNWSAVYNAPCVNSKVEVFLRMTAEMIDNFFPLKSVKVHGDDKPFITGRIKQMIYKRDNLYQRGRMTEFRSVRNQIVFEIRKEKQKFYNGKTKPARCSEPKAWWNNIKRIVGKKREHFVLTNPETDAPLNSKETTNLINYFFTSLTNDYPEVKDEWLNVGSEDSLPYITVDIVAKKLSHLKVNKAVGPFDPNTKLIKYFAKYFAFPLSHIYNESFTCRLFPEIWKISNVCGIPIQLTS